jgi:antitoxin component of MazEF toxin-antitoxin module
MVQEDTGRFGAASRGKTGIIYVPADLVKDITFPFANGDSLVIRIDEDRLIVEKAGKRKKD